MNFSNARQKNESFNKYRKRLKEVKAYIKNKSKGTMIWSSSRDGTYIRVKHGYIGINSKRG